MIMTIFNHIRNLTVDKKPVTEYSDEDMKSFNPYIINMWLSMNKDLIEIINQFQKYTIGILDKREVYKLYLGILPKKRIFLKYIKGTTENNDKVINEIANLVQTQFQDYLSKQEISEYINLYFDKENIEYMLHKAGVENRKIKTLLKKL